MSLIDEALKRARQEAAQQDAARRGAAQPWMPMPLAPLPARRLPVAAIGAIALALLLVGGGTVWLLGRGAPSPATPSPAPPRLAAVSTPGAPAPAAAAPALPAPNGPSDRRDQSDRSQAVAAPPEATRRATVDERASQRRDVASNQTAAPRPARDRRADRAETGEPARESSSATRSSTESRIAAKTAEARPKLETAAPEDGSSHVREVALPNGHKLELRGIAFSDTQPVVLINGKVLSPGEAVEGYTVAAIEQGRVTLKGGTGTLYLTLQ